MRNQHTATRLLTGLATMVAALSMPLGAATAAPATDTAPQAPTQSEQSKTDTTNGTDQNQNNKENDPAPAAPAKPGQTPTNGNTGSKAKTGATTKGSDKQAPAKPALSTRDYSCTVGTSTFQQCFPDETFRAFMISSYSPDGSSWTSTHWQDYNDTVVTQSWADSVTQIHGSNMTGTPGLSTLYVHDISGMQILTNLTVFDVGEWNDDLFSNVQDFGPMSHLTNLQTVRLKEMSLDNVNLQSWDSANMPALTTFDAYWSGFTDFATIKHLTNLTDISVRHTSLAATNKDPLHNVPDWFPNLQSLDISETRFLRKTMDYTPLTAARMPTLRVLDVHGIGTGTIEEQLNVIPDSFKDMTQLTSLNVNHNHIVDVSPLKVLTNLQVLDVSQNNIYDLSPLGTLNNLTTLDAHDEYWVSEANPVARPNVTLNLNQAIDNYGQPVQDYGNRAHFRYSSEMGQQVDAYLPDEDVKLDATHHQITLVDPHAAPATPLTPAKYLVDGQVRVGNVYVSFAKPLTNRTTGASIGTFNGDTLQPVRPPQASVDLRGGSADGKTSIDPVTVISGRTTTLPTPTREDADFLGWKACVTGATNPQGSSCSYENATDIATKGVDVTVNDDVTYYARWSDDTNNNGGNGNNSGDNNGGGDNGNGGGNGARPSATGDPNKGKGGLAATGASAITIALIGIASAIAGSTALRRKKANSQQ